MTCCKGHDRFKVDALFIADVIEMPLSGIRAYGSLLVRKLHLDNGIMSHR